MVNVLGRLVKHVSLCVSVCCIQEVVCGQCSAVYRSNNESQRLLHFSYKSIKVAQPVQEMLNAKCTGKTSNACFVCVCMCACLLNIIEESPSREVPDELIFPPPVVVWLNHPSVELSIPLILSPPLNSFSSCLVKAHQRASI